MASKEWTHVTTSAMEIKIKSHFFPLRIERGREIRCNPTVFLDRRGSCNRDWTLKLMKVQWSCWLQPLRTPGQEEAELVLGEMEAGLGHRHREHPQGKRCRWKGVLRCSRHQHGWPSVSGTSSCVCFPTWKRIQFLGSNDCLWMWEAQSCWSKHQRNLLRLWYRCPGQLHMEAEHTG